MDFEDSQTAYLLTFPAAVDSVGRVLEMAQPGSAARLRAARAEPVPARPRHAGDEEADSPAGQWMALFRELPEYDAADSPAQRAARPLLGKLLAATYHASWGSWNQATREVRSACRRAWTLLGHPA